MAKSKKSRKQFKFSNQATTGALEATRDQFLEECFIDKGDVDVVSDLGDHRCIIIGRTGAGKTALLKRIEILYKDKVIAISPHDLALSFIANNKVIQTYDELGVNLSPFYRLLWKHVFITEIIKKHYNIRNQTQQNTFLNHIAELLRRDKAKQEALNYLREWGDKFWETTEVRIKEVVKKVTTQLETTASGGVKGTITGVEGSTEVGRKKGEEKSEEEKSEVINKAHAIIDDIQLSKLRLLVNTLSENILTDRQRFYYITIDQLDEDWAEESIRYRLIFELLATIAELNNQLQDQVKIVVGLREDLLQRVYAYIQENYSFKFQKEKYVDLYYRLNWTVTQLKQVLKKRIEYFPVKKYVSEQVTLEEVFPDSIILKNIYTDKREVKKPVDYLLERTMLVPRDIIRFANRCIEGANAQNTGIITKTVILNAERHYSEDRLNALEDEWRVNFPNLRQACELLRAQSAKFTIVDFDLQHNKIDGVFGKMSRQDCPIYTLLNKAYTDVDLSIVLGDLFYIFFVVGVIGIEKYRNSIIHWSYAENRVTNADFHDPQTTFYIHPAYFSALDVKPIKSVF